MRRLLRPLSLAIGLSASLSCAIDRPLASTASMRTMSAATANSTSDVQISEFHYDNPGTDVDEKIEISGPAGMSLDGWRLVLYNGSSSVRAPYTTTSLTGLAVSATCGDRGVVVVAYGTNGIQNGSSSATGIDPDGLALVDASGSVVEFLSYEGSFTALSGPAAGLTSTDIGVRELGAAPEAAAPPVWSLARNGAGVWAPPAPNTFGACNDGTSPAEVASVTIEPAIATTTVGATAAFTATALDADDQPISGVSITWSSGADAIATVSATGVATGVSEGDAQIRATAPNGVFGEGSLHVDEALPLPPVNIVEIHYDNVGDDVGEAIEIEGPAGQSLVGWSIVLYNQTGGVSYNTRGLTGVIADQCLGRGTLHFTYPANGIQNGPADGIALVAPGNVVVEFLSYEGTLTATNGPAAGMTSADIGVDETTTTPIGRSLQNDAIGWYGPASASFGACNVAPAPFVSIFGRAFDDPALPVGFESQFFATLNDGRGGTTASTFVWTMDTPALGSVDQDGVLHAFAAGTAVIRATAPNGATGMFSQATHVATASATAQYVGNTEFGVPTDGDASDDFIVTRSQYSSSFNRSRGIPNWVSFNLEQTHFGPEDRCNCFTYDPQLPANFARYTTADYTGAGAFHGYGIDRGHLARSFDRTSGNLDNATTYYFSNIIPQAADNNQGPWANMEFMIGNRARFQDKEVYIIAGASGSKGTVKNEGLITIPAVTWKVVVVMPRNQGRANVTSYKDVEVIAVVMPNEPGIRSFPNDTLDWQQYITTVNAVEKISGYDVLALLDDRIEDVVETGMQDEMALVDQLVADRKLNKGNGNALTSKLEVAAASIDRGNNTAAVNQLDAFLNQVDAFEQSGKLGAVDANALRTAISALIASLSS